MGFSFGIKSRNELASCHPDLVQILLVAISDIRIDFGVNQGGRTFEEQLYFFKKGASKLDPRIPGDLEKAKHVITEKRPLSEAVDLHVAAKFKKDSLTWDALHLTYIASYVIATADRLFNEGRIQHKVRWGGNWDKDSVIVVDQAFDDLCHLELFKP